MRGPGRQKLAVLLAALTVAAVAVAVLWKSASDTASARPSATPDRQRQANVSKYARERVMPGSPSGDQTQPPSAIPPVAATEPAAPPEAAPPGRQPSEPAMPAPARQGILPYPTGHDFVMPHIPANADEAELRRLKAEGTPEQWAEAEQRLRIHFQRWRGRDGDRLGGFAFEPLGLTELSGWTVMQDRVENWTMYLPKVPPICAHRHIALESSDGYLHIQLFVCVSIEAAHYLLRHLPRRPFEWGDGIGVDTGDVSFLDTRPIEVLSRKPLTFVRRNVVVGINLTQKRTSSVPPQLDVQALSRKMDAQIIEQGHPARHWSELQDVCPLIREFALDDPVWVYDPDEPWPPRRPDRPHSLSVRPLRLTVIPSPGMELVYYAPEEADALGGLAWVYPQARDPANVRLTYPPNQAGWKIDRVIATLQSEESVETTAWLFVIDKKSLLFSVATLTLTIRRK